MSTKEVLISLAYYQQLKYDSTIYKEVSENGKTVIEIDL